MWVSERLFSCGIFCSDSLSGCECVFTSSGSLVALIYLPSKDWLLPPGLITSNLSLSLERTLTDRAVCFILPYRVSRYTHTGDIEQCGRVNGHSCFSTWPNLHRDGLCLRRHFLVYGNKLTCFIAFLWALESLNHQTAEKCFGMKKEREREDGTPRIVLTTCCMGLFCCDTDVELAFYQCG